jgi:hypothetical protein
MKTLRLLPYLLPPASLCAQAGSGGRRKGAQITLPSTDTGSLRPAESGPEGSYRLLALPVGSYRLDVTAARFTPARVNTFSVAVGQTQAIDITHSPAAASTQITVQESVLVVNRDDTANSVSISARAMQDLPIRGRNFQEFVQLTPNVMQEGNRYGIVVNGQRSINGNISVDGVDFSDSLQGGSRGGGPNESAYFFPQLAVREFQVVASGVSAEVGRTNSGYINVVTKSGSNTYHGESFYANRNGAMTAKDAFGNDSSSNSQSQFGVSAGGPLQRDRTFSFGAVEKNIVTIPYTVKSNPVTNVVVPAAILSQQGSFDQKNNPLVAFGRLDRQFGARHTANLQYTYAAQYGLNFGGQSGQTTAASTNNTILDRASQGVKAGLTSVLSPHLLNELRGQWAYDNRQQVPNSTLAEVSIADFGTLGGSKNGASIYEATRLPWLDHLTAIRGRHTLSKWALTGTSTPSANSGQPTTATTSPKSPATSSPSPPTAPRASLPPPSRTTPSSSPISGSCPPTSPSTPASAGTFNATPSPAHPTLPTPS